LTASPTVASRRHGWLARGARAALGLIGWHVVFDGLPAPRGIAIVYPHTSNWDFVLGLLAKWAVGLPIRWVGKESLSRGWPASPSAV
jgi:1-acyl-sn-glycerol-3-phosphate acyltransferase